MKVAFMVKTEDGKIIHTETYQASTWWGIGRCVAELIRVCNKIIQPSSEDGFAEGVETELGKKEAELYLRPRPVRRK